ncbi:hypothetical protein [Crocosphaera sp.]|uniref:hypothetical protein n=1 Tax=Crocosphaera sp. TaxID=2729996 RepID=UPI00260BD70B|nr:hypothetical protein [Crocosphaera sp.]MDJ0579041.1 hypothetical protein [Crocosphaera sp.]
MTNEILKDFTKIETDSYYPDGDEIVIFVGQHNGHHVLTDFGGLYCFPWMPYEAPEKEPVSVQRIMDNVGIQIKKGCFFKKHELAPTEKDIKDFCEGLLEIANYWDEDGRGYRISPFSQDNSCPETCTQSPPS